MRGTSLLAALGLVILASTAVSWQVSPKPSYSDGCFSSVIEDPGDISLSRSTARRTPARKAASPALPTSLARTAPSCGASARTFPTAQQDRSAAPAGWFSATATTRCPRSRVTVQVAAATQESASSITTSSTQPFRAASTTPTAIRAGLLQVTGTSSNLQGRSIVQHHRGGSSCEESSASE